MAFPPALLRYSCADHTAKVSLGLAWLSWSGEAPARPGRAVFVPFWQPMSMLNVLHVYERLVHQQSRAYHQLKPQFLLCHPSSFLGGRQNGYVVRRFLSRVFWFSCQQLYRKCSLYRSSEVTEGTYTIRTVAFSYARRVLRRCGS